MHDEPTRRRFGAAAAERAREYTLEALGPRWDDLIASVSSEPSRAG